MGKCWFAGAALIRFALANGLQGACCQHWSVSPACQETVELLSSCLLFAAVSLLAPYLPYDDTGVGLVGMVEENGLISQIRNLVGS